jgi:phosphoribosylaminoimidazole-succinocarboxamide synthase
MTSPLALIDSDIPQLKLLSKGKVRDIYATSSPEHLLFVASDRISAYDVIMKNVNLATYHPSLSFNLRSHIYSSWPDHGFSGPKGVPEKGCVLTKLSLFWFDKLKSIIPNHVVTSRIQDMPEEVQQHKEQLEGRSILVKKAEVIPLEAIVRGYITGEHSVNWINSTTLDTLCLF